MLVNLFVNVAAHTGSNPCVNQLVHFFPNYLTTNCPNISLIEKIQKNLENIQSESKIRKIYSLGRKSGSRIPENFVHEIFIKSHFRGGLCYKFFLKNDCNPQKSMFFCIFHVLHIPPQDQTAYIIYVVNMGKKLAKSWTIYNHLQTKIPGKNRIRKIREKSGYQIPIILGQILRMDTINYSFMA